MKIFAALVMASSLSACQFVQESPSSTPTLKKLSVNGTTLTYLEQGTGPTVVFLHGAYSDHRIWEPQRESVAKSYRFIALDLRYFGTAPWSDEGTHFSQATHVADVAAFIRELKVGPVRLVGRSYGATTALAVALRHPQLVRGLFLNEPGLVSAVTNPADQKIAAEDRKCMEAVGAAAKAGNTAEATRLFFECVNGQPGGFDALPPDSRAMHLDNAQTVPPPAQSEVTHPYDVCRTGRDQVARGNNERRTDSPLLSDHRRRSASVYARVAVDHR